MSVDNLKAVLEALGVTVLYDGPNAAYVTLSDSLRDFDCFALVMQYSQSGVNTAILAGAAGAADAYAGTLCGSYVNTDQAVYATFNFNIGAKTIQSTTSWRIRQVIGIRL